jgi:DNA-binding NtrC family response regulator
MTATKSPADAALKILIVDDDRSVAYALDRALTENGHEVAYVFSVEQGLKSLKEAPVDVVLLDLVMPGMDGIEMLRQVKSRHFAIDVVTMSGAGGMRAALGTLQLDAFDFLPKPIQWQALEDVIGRLRQKRQKSKGPGKDRPLSALFTVPDLMGQSEGMKWISAFIQKISSVTSSVLIRGETGTGKEIAAHGIHNRSPRRDGPFIAVNCSALPETMLESELFGHEKGAFTDATGLKRGLLEVSGGGTLFLDEIGDMPLALQAKLLRVVETKRFRRLGSTVEHAVDVRFLAATHRDLEEMVRKGQFREDLFYRLSVFTLVLPPLRERREDGGFLPERIDRRTNRQNPFAGRLGAFDRLPLARQRP